MGEIGELRGKVKTVFKAHQVLRRGSKQLFQNGSRRYLYADETGLYENDQLLPGFNVQMGICDEYIAVFDVKQYASDMDCFVPLVERFVQLYGFYPRYPVADAGYGSFNNYLYCGEHGMEKYMKFSTYEKESKDEAYRDDPYRAVNFAVDEEGNLLCPGNRKLHFLKTFPSKTTDSVERKNITNAKTAMDANSGKIVFAEAEIESFA